MKEFFEAEFDIVDYRLEWMQVANNGRHEQEHLLSAVKINFEGKDVWVGSGLSREERRKYAADPQSLLKAQVTVQYFEESRNAKDSLKSLRFPTVKAIYENGRSC